MDNSHYTGTKVWWTTRKVDELAVTSFRSKTRLA